MTFRQAAGIQSTTSQTKAFLLLLSAKEVTPPGGLPLKKHSKKPHKIKKEKDPLPWLKKKTVTLPPVWPRH